jgi:hypothetical protein
MANSKTITKSNAFCLLIDLTALSKLITISHLTSERRMLIHKADRNFDIIGVLPEVIFG